MTQVQAGAFTPDCYALLTRDDATTTYGVDEHVAQDTNAANVLPLKFPALRIPNGSGTILTARLSKSTATIANAAFRLWLFTRQPFAAGAYPVDNAAFVTALTFTALKSCIGYIDFMASDFIAGDTSAYCEGVGSRAALPFSLAQVGRATDADALILPDRGLITGDRLLYGNLTARAAYAPGASEQFKIDLDIAQD